MNSSPRRSGLVLAAIRWAHSPLATRLLRYSAVSVVSLVLSEGFLVAFNGGLGWGGALSSTAATGLATVPAYFLNRHWVWSQSGRSHLWKEVVPFWAIAVFGWAWATAWIALTDHLIHSRRVGSPISVFLIAATYLVAYGVLWVAKFVVFNRVIFVPKSRA